MSPCSVDMFVFSLQFAGVRTRVSYTNVTDRQQGCLLASLALWGKCGKIHRHHDEWQNNTTYISYNLLSDTKLYISGACLWDYYMISYSSILYGLSIATDCVTRRKGHLMSGLQMLHQQVKNINAPHQSWFWGVAMSILTTTPQSVLVHSCTFSFFSDSRKTWVSSIIHFMIF